LRPSSPAGVFGSNEIRYCIAARDGFRGCRIMQSAASHPNLVEAKNTSSSRGILPAFPPAEPRISSARLSKCSDQVPLDFGEEESSDCFVHCHKRQCHVVCLRIYCTFAKSLVR
jgi:hypothetical protein